MTNQWVVLLQYDESGRYEEGARIKCAFVVAPHNQEALETFVTWCVREQISTTTTGSSAAGSEGLIPVANQFRGEKR
jgi:hypothetical protein